MARTRLFSVLRRTLRQSLGAAGLTRRDFLKRTAVAASAVVVGPRLAACDDDSETLTVGIVGAGLAGLMCARELAKAGIDAQVYEAQQRVGGRMWTERELMASGQIIELGGELIDTEHELMQSLAAELGLTLDDYEVIDADVKAEVFHFGGQRVSINDILAAWGPLATRMLADLEASERDDADLERLDALSIRQYLAAVSGLDPTFRSILEIAYTEEFGLEPDEQSAMNLIWLIGSDDPEDFNVFGSSDERFHVHLGNDFIPLRIADALPNPVLLGRELVSVSERGDHFVLAFRDGSTAKHQHVVLAMPFTTLRLVTFDPPLPPDKATIVNELGYGMNAKLMLQFDSKPWRDEHHTAGTTFSDAGFQTTWETSRGQLGKEGILTIFVGGDEGTVIGEGTPESRAEGYLPALDVVFPGTAAAYRNGSAVRMHWPTFKWSRGSYACYRPGQAVWSGTEGERVGNLHFCGEHTSEDFQGYMEGAAESGVRAAREIIDG